MIAAAVANTRNTNEGSKPPVRDIRSGADRAPRLKENPSKFSAAPRAEALKSETSALVAVLSTPPPTPYASAAAASPG